MRAHDLDLFQHPPTHAVISDPTAQSAEQHRHRRTTDISPLKLMLHMTAIDTVHSLMLIPTRAHDLELFQHPPTHAVIPDPTALSTEHHRH
jgi:hypothetical protein